MAAADRKGKSIVFDAVTDTYAAKVVRIAGATFQGTGLTATNRVLMTDDNDDVVVDYVVEAATDNADLWGGRPPQQYHGLKMSGAVDGTWALTVFLE